MSEALATLFLAKNSTKIVLLHVVRIENSDMFVEDIPSPFPNPIAKPEDLFNLASNITLSDDVVVVRSAAISLLNLILQSLEFAFAAITKLALIIRQSPLSTKVFAVMLLSLIMLNLYSLQLPFLNTHTHKHYLNLITMDSMLCHRTYILHEHHLHNTYHPRLV